MKIQSLSIVVPNKHCVNNCRFCVSQMHCDTYINQMDDNLPFFDLYLKDYLKRLEFARDNGCNTLMLTGNSEPQQNRKFLTYFGMMMQMMKNPFRWIEMQTTGVLLDRNYLRFLRNHVGINLISLSISSFDDEQNNDIIQTPGHTNSTSNDMPDTKLNNTYIQLTKLCQDIKEYDFALRLSLNLNSKLLVGENLNKLDTKTAMEHILTHCKALHADQVTLRILYKNASNTAQGDWINEHTLKKKTIKKLKRYIQENGTRLGALPHGAAKYNLEGLCIVIDEDCMDKIEKTDDSYKYLILQPNCKLYSAWDEMASLIF